MPCRHMFGETNEPPPPLADAPPAQAPQLPPPAHRAADAPEQCVTWPSAVLYLLWSFSLLHASVLGSWEQAVSQWYWAR